MIKIKTSLFSLGLAVTAASFSSCESIDNHRLPPANVNIVFSTIGDWEKYGVSGAGSYQMFVESLRIPAGFPYKGLEGTGFGGLLLIADPIGQYLVFDLACPVCSPEVQRIVPDSEQDVAGIFKCNKCGSRYDAFSVGTPYSGQALKDKIGLESYHITISQGSPYAIIYR